MEMAKNAVTSAFLSTDFAAGVFPSRWTPGLITLAIFITTLIATAVTKKAIFGTSTNKGATKLRQAPGPRPLPVIGNMHQLAGGGNLSLPRRLMELSATYGPVMSLHLGSVPMVVASSAEAVEQFLKVQDKVWSGRPRSLGFKLVSNNFEMAPDTPYWWKVLRKLFHRELLSHSRLETFRESRTEEFDQMVESIYEDSQRYSKEEGVKYDVTLGSKLTYLSANNITNMMLGKRFFGAEQPGQDIKFQSLIYKYLDVTKQLLIGDIVPSLKWLSYVSGSVAAMKKVVSDCDAYMQTHLDEKRRAIMPEIKTKNVVGNSNKSRQDLVDVLMEQPAVDGNGKLDDTSIACLVRNFLVAGTDTTSNTVEWAISELLRNPECMKKLQTELDSVVGTARVVTEADLPNLPYLQAIVKETLRLYPQGAIFIPHVSLEATTVCGYDFPAATWLMVNSLAIHLDESYWPNAQQFDPERFLINQCGPDEQELDVMGTNLHYMPFGIGRHQCPGMWLGHLVTQIGVARLVQAFDFSLTNGEDPRKLDMTEIFCQSMPRMHPLVLKAQPRLVPHLYKA